jgi:hypothetical protein
VSTDPMVSWLEAELGHVEELARAAGGDAWAVQEHPSETTAVYDSQRDPVVYDEGWPSDAQKRHIAEHDPVSVLRRVKADRQILAEHADAGTRECSICAPVDWDAEESPGWYRYAIRYPCRTVRLLAEARGWTCRP